MREKHSQKGGEHHAAADAEQPRQEPRAAAEQRKTDDDLQIHDRASDREIVVIESGSQGCRESLFCRQA